MTGRNTEFRRAFGRWLKRMREKRGWSVTRMAEALGVQDNAITEYENDGYRVPSFDTLPIFLTVFESEFIAFLMSVYLKSVRHPDDWRKE